MLSSQLFRAKYRIRIWLSIPNYRIKFRDTFFKLSWCLYFQFNDHLKFWNGWSPYLVDLANDILKLDPPLLTTDIEVSHRLKQRRNAKEGEPRPVIVRFRSKQERFRVISNRKNLKAHNDNQNNPFKIYVNEDLTYMRAKLFSTVRLLHKRKYFSQAWTHNGGIRVKDLQGTVKTIANTGDIQKLLPDIDLSSIM